jgi:hypothetical protein
MKAGYQAHGMCLHFQIALVHSVTASFKLSLLKQFNWPKEEEKKG